MNTYIAPTIVDSGTVVARTLTATQGVSLDGGSIAPHTRNADTLGEAQNTDQGGTTGA